jgi:hypothetical protein
MGKKSKSKSKAASASTFTDNNGATNRFDVTNKPQFFAAAHKSSSSSGNNKVVGVLDDRFAAVLTNPDF